MRSFLILLLASGLTSCGPAAGGSPASAATTAATTPPDFGSVLESQSAAVVAVRAVIPLAEDQDDMGDARLPRTAVRDEGSGFLVSRDGYILTNAHLVRDASWVSVRLAQRSGEWVARLVGIDTPTDIAVLKIAAHELPVARLGDSRRLKPGDWVAAIGAPYGLSGSISVGVVSALKRTLPTDEYYLPFIQTDLPLNPGNSGGPLFDSKGEVVGVNSQIVIRDGGSAGISFAVPIDVALDAAAQLIRNGRIERGDIGLEIQDVDAPLARAFGLGRPLGVLVHTVKRGGPAELAAVKAGDIILKLNGRAIQQASDFAAAISAASPGSTVVLAIWRRHRLDEVAVRVALLDVRPFTVQRTAGAGPESSFVLISVHQLTARERRFAGTEGHLLVTAVSEQAAAAGIEAGDIVLKAGATELRTTTELRQALARGADVLALLIERDGAQMYVALPVRYSAGR